MSSARNGPSRPPRLASGNVDEVLLTGKNRGKNLTLFQSVSLAALGLLFALCGAASILVQLAPESPIGRSTMLHTGSYSSVAWSIGLGLLGGMWLVFGLVGVTRAMKRQARP